MKRTFILLCLIMGILRMEGQRSYQFESPDRLFLEGKEFFDLRNYPGCVDKLNAFKGQSANKDLIQEADYMLAYIVFLQGHKDAVNVLEQYLNTYPDTRHQNEVCFLLGSAYFAEGQYESAIEWLNKSNIDLLSLEEQEAYAFRLAFSLLQTGDAKTARGYFARVQQIGTTYREAASYYVAYIDYTTGDYTTAMNEFLQLKDNPLYREQSLYYIAQIYYMQGKYDKVITGGEELLEAYPNSINNVEIYRILGNAYFHQGDQAKAITMLQNYVDEADEPLRGDLYLLGVCYYNKGNYKKAIESFSETVHAEDATTQNAYMYLGQSYLKLNDKNNARMAFELAATTTFDKQIQEAAMYNYALIIHETSFSGFGESVTIFEDFLNNFPQSQYADRVNDYLVEIYLTTKNYDAALTSINKIHQPNAKIYSAKQNIIFQLGTKAFTDQNQEDAIEYFTQAITMGHYDPEIQEEARFWRGESYYRTNNFNQAVSDYQSYLRQAQSHSTETYALANYNLGYSFFKLQDYGQALSTFRQYVNLERNSSAASYADAYNRIGDCLFYNRQFSAAEENYSKAASLQPSSGDYATYQKGFVLGLQKDYQGKINMMEQLIRNYPESQYIVNALYEKGRTYVLLENYNMAENDFNQLIGRSPQSSLARKAGLQLGLLYYNSNRPEKAVSAYKQVISNFPGSEEAVTAIQDLKSVYVDMNDVASYAAYVNSLGGNIHFEVSEQDSLTYFAAEKQFLRGDNEDAARRSLRNYLSSFPHGAFSSNANYYLGTIAFSKKEYAEAKQQYEDVISSGDTRFIEDAWARKAEIEYVTKDYAAAMKSFKQLQSIAESTDNREAAKLGLMRCAQFTNQHAEALDAANELLKNAKLSPEIATEARYLRAKSHIALKEDSKAEADLQTLSKDTRTVYGAESKYLLAKYYYDKNETDKAEKELMDFIQKGTTHQYWLARGFILLSDVYIRKGDDFQARQYLTSLQKNYKGKDDITGMIEERLGKLKK